MRPEFLLFTHADCLDHGSSAHTGVDPGGHPGEHPENAGRLSAILKKLRADPTLSSLLEDRCDRKIERHELLRLHTSSYIDVVYDLRGQLGEIDPETPVTAGSVLAAERAAGLALEMVERIWKGELKRGFSLVRPPGHHARPAGGMGFCIFNNIALAASHLLALGAKRILILDWDVHHGNGTQEAFYESDQVMLIDLHQEDLFPRDSGRSTETGGGKGLGFTLNLPLPHSSEDADYLRVLDAVVDEAVKKFKPEILLVSAGFDAHISDPLGSMSLTTDGFVKMTRRVMVWAESFCGGRLALFLEGGYVPEALAQNVAACAGVLTGR